MKNNFPVPILFLIFNRPEKTQAVFEVIRSIKPLKLYIAADGPRKNKIKDRSRCLQAREITEKIDWECDVKRLYRKKNLGCKLAVSKSIDWFFSNVDEGLILEDDCIPDLSFFKFVEKMLNRYRNNSKIMHISGNNFQTKWDENYSYYFSIYPHIWGWATWKRAWEKYDVNMKDWNANNSEYILGNLDYYEKKYWKTIFDLSAQGKFDTWDYQWTYCCLKNGGLSIIPQKNLVINIGADSEATHTKTFSLFLKNMKKEKLQFPLIHPNLVEPNRKADRFVSTSVFGIENSIVGYVSKIISINIKAVRQCLIPRS